MSTAESDPGAFLKNILSRRMSHNPAYSLRAFARDLELSHSFLSLLMRGKRRLSLRQAGRVADLLKLEIDERSTFLQYVTLSQARMVSFRDSSTAPDEAAHELDAEKFALVSEWYHGAIMELLKTQGSKKDVSWIARRLNVSEDSVHKALFRLHALGLLSDSKEDAPEAPLGHVVYLPKKSEEAARKYHRQMLIKAMDQLENAPSQDKFDRRDFSGITIAVHPDKIAEAKKLLAQFKRKLRRLLQSDQATAVYQLNLQLFPLAEADGLGDRT